MVFSRVEIWWIDGRVRTGRPVNEQPSGLFARHTFKFIVDDDDVDSDTVAESDMSFISRSFLNRVNDRLRKMLDRSPEDPMQDIDKRSMIRGMFVSSTVEACVFMGRITQTTLRSIKNPGNNLTMKQMFDTSEQLILEQSDEIFGVSQISWENSPWKQLSLVNDEEVISLLHAKVYVFSDSVSCLGKMNQNPQSNTFGETSWRGSRVHHNAELWTQLTVSQLSSSGIFSQDSPHCSSATKSKSSCLNWAIHQNNLKDGSCSCRCSTTSHGDLKTMNKKVRTPTSLLSMQEDFHQEDGHSSDLDQKRSGIPLTKKDQEENGTKSLT